MEPPKTSTSTSLASFSDQDLLLEIEHRVENSSPAFKEKIQTAIKMTLIEDSSQKKNTDLIHDSENANDLLKALENLQDKKVLSKSTKHFQTTPLNVFNSEGSKVMVSSSVRKDLFERYEVLKTLGEGGMGVVQLVRDRLLGREVALKRLKVTSSSPFYVKKQKHLLWRLKKEASITAILEHPNIVPLYEMQSSESGEIQFTMRKIEGSTLREIFQQLRMGTCVFDSKQLLSIFLKVCDAVGYAHSKGIVHRDLKPENIMVGEYGEVYVMDWGIAKDLKFKEKETDEQLSKKTIDKTQGGIGTYGYMPPEQATTVEITLQADIYALGKILKECFLFTSPLEEFREMIKSYDKNKTAESGRPEVQIIPKDISAIVEKATQENPEDRYLLTKALAQDVEKYLHDIPISVREYGIGELIKKGIKRNQQKLIVIMVIVAVALIVGFYGQWKKNQDLQKRYQNALAKSYQEKNKAETVQDESNLAQEARVTSWLSALYFADKALEIHQEKEIEVHKLKIGKALQKFCFESKNYYLASYVAQKIGELTILSSEEKKRWKTEVSEEQEKLLNQHMTRLQYWIKKFKESTIQEGERTDALFEISKMQEKPILDYLLKELKEGTRYYLREKTNTSTPHPSETYLKAFYPFVAEAIGRIENKETAEIVFKEFEQIYEKLVHTPPAMRDEKEEYAVALFQSLGNLNKTSLGEKLAHFRWMLGQNLSFWNKTQYAQQKMIEELLQETNKKIQLQQNDFQLYFIQGLSNYEKMDWDASIKDYSKVIQLQPKYELAYLNRGNAYAKKGEFLRAIEDFNTAIQLNSSLAQAYISRGMAKTDGKEFQSAIEDFNQAIRLNPNDTLTYIYRATAKTKKKEWTSALEDCNQAIQLNPKLSNAYMARGNLQLDQGDVEKAIENFNRAIELDPKDALSYLNRGNAYARKGKLDEAIEDFNHSILLNPKYPLTYNNRGNVWLEKRIFFSAFSDFNRAIQLDPKNADFYVNRGNAYLNQENFTNAIEEYYQALQLSPNYKEAYYNLGMTYRNLRDHEKALYFWEKGLQLQHHPKVHQDFLNLLFEEASIHYRRKEYERSQSLFKKFQQSAPPEHPKWAQAEKALQQIEKVLNEKKK